MSKITKENKVDKIEKDNFSVKLFISIIFICFLIFYIAYHFYNGRYGFENYINKQDMINSKKLSIQKTEKEILEIKNKIEKLQDENIDTDLIDEEIRKNTGYVKQNEIILYTKDLEE